MDEGGSTPLVGAVLSLTLATAPTSGQQEGEPGLSTSSMSGTASKQLGSSSSSVSAHRR